MAKVRCYRCSRTGMLFPSNYAEEWGKTVGVGMGPKPISEALVNDYHRPVVANKKGVAMHPVSVCRAPIDYLEVEEEEYAMKKAVLMKDDPDLVERSKIMRGRQLVHSNKLRSMCQVEAQEADEKEIIRKESVADLHTRLGIVFVN